jgi:SAM-dependent methyltransferase
MSQVNEHALNATFEFDALREAHAYRRGLLREFGPFLGRRVLEIGAGIGQFTELLARQPGVERVLAVEPDATLCAEFRRQHPQIRLIEGTLQSAQPKPEWESVVCVNVLEHIEHDAEELAQYQELLRPSRGLLCLFVPARPEIYAPIDRDFGHFRRYRRPELAQKLEAAGFLIRRLHYFNLIGYAAWWWMFRIRQQRKFDLSSVRLFDRWIFPVTSFLEQRIVRPPIGQSLVAIAEANRP